MLLPVEVGLVDGEGVDEILNLAFRVAAQTCEVVDEGFRPGGPHSFDNASLHVVTLALGEHHARAAIQELAQTPKFVLGDCRIVTHLTGVAVSEYDPR